VKMIMIFGLHKRWEISLLAELLLASQEGLRSMVLGFQILMENV
jgi:hypothetical protein